VFALHGELIDAAAQETTGVLGRIQRTLERDVQYRTAGFSISGNQRILDGHTRPPWHLSLDGGVVEWQRAPALGAQMQRLHTNETSSPFAETIGATLSSSIEDASRLGGMVSRVRLATDFPQEDSSGGVNVLSRSLEQIARVIRTRHERQDVSRQTRPCGGKPLYAAQTLASWQPAGRTRSLKWLLRCGKDSPAVAC
jgi:hypothetical protein